MKAEHTGFVDAQVFFDLRSNKKKGSYMVHLNQSRYVKSKEKDFINVTITLRDRTQ